MRTTVIQIIEDVADVKKRLLLWAQQFEEVVWLDSNEYPDKYSTYDAILAVEAFTAIQTDYSEGFEKLQEYQEVSKDWIFGYLSYDLKNNTEELSSKNRDELNFPELYFFQPKKLFLLQGNRLEIQYLKMVDDQIAEDLERIAEASAFSVSPREERMPVVKARIPKEDYLLKVGQMLEHIHRGDIYEANFCQEFYAENVELDPFKIFSRLNSVSLAPFAAFLKFDNNFLFSASPERYIKKVGSKIISQPIKGTAPRADDPEEDKSIAELLSTDPKERSENIMIVDLVRNDLSRTATEGSVEVEELCKVYTFKQVHQLISTVKSILEPGVPPVEVLRTTFPMGSMTGAPKISAMKIIDELEETKRSLYSGALGYFTPSGNFDFNVVIRSILYSQKRSFASFSVGGAITANSVPEREYEECLLKAKAMREVLEG